MKLTKQVVIKVVLAFALGGIAGYFVHDKVQQWLAKKK